MISELPLGDPVPIAAAPERPAAVLAGRDVTLRRPDLADGAPLFAATHGDLAAEAVWAYMGYGPWPNEEAMSRWIAGCVDSVDPFWYAVTATADGSPLGMAAIMGYDPAMRRAEIGHIWYIPAAQRTTANTEAAYLMVGECFARMGCRRVEWKCDALNERSRAAAVRLGFVFEGVFRNHMIVKGRNRDTAWYAMTPGDWSSARPRLERWLYEAPRRDGRPVEPLGAR